MNLVSLQIVQMAKSYGTREITRLDIMAYLIILDQSHKGCVLQIAKVLLQISFKHSEPFLEFLVNF